MNNLYPPSTSGIGTTGVLTYSTAMAGAERA
jgi:hypothetical protein